MEELYKVMDDLLDVEFQMKSGIDLLKELEDRDFAFSTVYL